MKRLVLLFAVLLVACGPDRAQTVSSPTGRPPTEIPAGPTAEPSSPVAPTDEPEPTAEPAPTDEPTPVEEPDAGAADLDQDALIASLLTLDDMPTGWTAEAPTFEPRTPGGTYNVFCVERTARSIGRAAVDFEQSALGPYLSHTIVIYPDRQEAEDALADFISAAQECPELVNEDGETTTIGPLSFPNLGDDSFAIRSVTGGIEFDSVQIRIDNAIVNILHGGFGGVDSAATEAFARAAVDQYK